MFQMQLKTCGDIVNECTVEGVAFKCSRERLEAHLEGPSKSTGWNCKFVHCTRSTAQWLWVLQLLLPVLQAAWSQF